MILRIPEDDLEEFNIQDVNFTPARFDNGPYAGSGVIEQEIVTTTGPYIVRWKFRQVKMDYNKERLQDGKSVSYHNSSDLAFPNSLSNRLLLSALLSISNVAM